MESSKAKVEKLVIDYFNHGRNTPPGTWHTGQPPELKQHTANRQEIRPKLQQNGDSDDD